MAVAVCVCVCGGGGVGWGGIGWELVGCYYTWGDRGCLLYMAGLTGVFTTLGGLSQ